MLYVHGFPGSGKSYYIVERLLEIQKKVEKKEVEYRKKNIPYKHTIIANIEGLELDHIDLETEIARFSGYEIISESRIRAGQEKIKQLKIDLDDAKKEKLKGSVRAIEKEINRCQIYLDKNFNAFKKWRKYFLENSEQVVTKYFTIDNFEEFYGASEEHNITLVIDECQFWLGQLSTHKKETKAVIYFFAFHRHIGLEIIAASQDMNDLPRQITGKFDDIIYAKARAMGSGANTLAYDRYVGKKKVNVMPLTKRKNKRIFALYKSQRADQVVKSKSAFGSVLKLMLVAILVMLASGYYLKSKLGAEIKKSNEDTKVKEQVARAEAYKKRIAKNEKPVKELNPKNQFKGKSPDQIRSEALARKKEKEVGAGKETKKEVRFVRVDSMRRFLLGEWRTYYWDKNVGRMVLISEQVVIGEDSMGYVEVDGEVFEKVIVDVDVN